MDNTTQFSEKDKARFLAKVDKQDGGCWQWAACINMLGYARFSFQGRSGFAHVVAYRMFKGLIPEGLHLDHLCRNRSCVNPDHLEPVTCKINLHRGIAPSMITHLTGVCKRGHVIDGDNVKKMGARSVCKTCYKVAQAKGEKKWAAKPEVRARRTQQQAARRQDPEVRERENARRRKNAP